MSSQQKLQSQVRNSRAGHHTLSTATAPNFTHSLFPVEGNLCHTKRALVSETVSSEYCTTWSRFSTTCSHSVYCFLSLLFFAVLSYRRCISKKSKDPTYSSEHQTKRPSSIRTHQSKTSLKKNCPRNYHQSNNIPPQPQYPTSLVYVIVLCNFLLKCNLKKKFDCDYTNLGFNLFVLYTETKSEQMGDQRWSQRVSTYIIFQSQYERGRGYAMKGRVTLCSLA